MAIDKNSKAYQNLLNSGYTDEQITQMHNDVAWGKTTQEAVANTQPTTPSNTPTPTPTQTTPEVKQETEIKQQETVGSTVPEIKQEWALKPLSQEYYNQTSQEAQDKIVSNLNWYRQTNPEFFSDYESFKKNFSYDSRNEEQKRTLDTRYWGYQKWMQLAWLPTTDLYTQYKDWQVSAAELENLRIYDPTKYAELQTQINKWNIVAAYDDDKWVDTTGKTIQEMAYDMMVQTFTNFLNWDTSSWASQYFREYEDKMNDPEMLGLSDKCTEVQEEMENIQSDLDAIKKQVESEYAGTWASRSKINAIISDRSYDLQLQLRTLNSEYNKYATQYNNRMNQYQTEFQMQLQEYQINQQERQQQMNELWFAMDLMSFETPQQAQEREWDYWVKQQEYQNGDINSSDYATRYKAALNSVKDLLNQYDWIPMQRSAEQMAQDILQAIDWGSNLGAELTKINKLIQQKPEYKYLYNQTFKPASSSSWIQTYKVGDTEWVMYNWEMMTSDDFNKKYWGNYWGTAVTDWGVEYSPVNPLFLQGAVSDWKNENKDWSYWGQCGKFVNDYLQSIWLNRLYGNSIASKMNTINTDKKDLGNLSIWSVAVFDYSWIPTVSDNAKKYGHVWIVVDIDETWQKVKLLESNLKWDEKVSTRWVTVNWQSLRGFFDPSKTLWWELTASEEGLTTWNWINANYVESRVWLYDRYVNEWTAPTDAKLKAIGGWDLDKGWQIFDAEVADYMNKTWAWTLDKKKNDEIVKLRKDFNQEPAVKDYKSMLTNYTKIETSAKKETAQWDMSLIFSYMKMLDPNSVVREWEYATAENAGNVPTKWIQAYNKAVKGTKLTKQQRQNMLDTARSLMDWATQNYNQLLDDYAGYINYWWDMNQIGKKWTYITSEYRNKYWTNTWTRIKVNTSPRLSWIPSTTNTTSTKTTTTSSVKPWWTQKYNTNSKDTVIINGIEYDLSNF